MNRLYKFETINRVTSELYPEEYWRLGTSRDIKIQYALVIETPNLIPHITYLDNDYEATFVVTLSLKGYMQTNVIGYYKVRILIRKLEMLDKRISFKVRMVGPSKNGNHMLMDDDLIKDDDI